MPVAVRGGQSEVGCGQPRSHRVDAGDAGDACDLVFDFLFGPNAS